MHFILLHTTFLNKVSTLLPFIVLSAAMVGHLDNSWSNDTISPPWVLFSAKTFTAFTFGLYNHSIILGTYLGSSLSMVFIFHCTNSTYLY